MLPFLAAAFISAAGALMHPRAAAQATGAAPPKAAVCAACHGASGKPGLPAYPILAGQTARYSYLQLRDFQEGQLTHELTTPRVVGMTRDEMRELADYPAKQKPPPQVFAASAEKARVGKLKSDEKLCTMRPWAASRGRTRCHAWPGRTSTTSSSS